MGSNTQVTVSSKEHIPVLDGIRAVAVLIVICFHFWQNFTQGPYSWIGKVAIWGQTGVDLFFVLSGFLITGILLDSKGSENFLRNFYVRRILRIFPLYYATLLAVYLIGPLLHLNGWTPWSKNVWYWVYLQNITATFAPSRVSGPGHFWSLAVEEHYYLVWPFMVMAFARDKLLRLIGVAIAITLATRVIFLHYGTFFFTLARLDGLGIGSALAIFARSERGGLARYEGWAKGLLCALGPLLVISQWLVSGKALPAIQILKSTLIALIYASIMVLAIGNRLGRVVNRLLSGRVLGSVGKYSYGMYVLHPFVMGWLHDAGILPYSVPGLFLSIFATYAAAWVSWTLLEKRFLRLKRYFEYAPRRERQPASIMAAGI